MSGLQQRASAGGAAKPPAPASGHSELQAALLGCTRAFTGTGLFSCVINLLMLTGPLFMLQVYDRVLTSRSIPTLLALVFLVAGLYAFLGVLEFLRGRGAVTDRPQARSGLGRAQLLALGFPGSCRAARG